VCSMKWCVFVFCSCFIMGLILIISGLVPRIMAVVMVVLCVSLLWVLFECLDEVVEGF